jgi:hypothetical protein
MLAKSAGKYNAKVAGAGGSAGGRVFLTAKDAKSAKNGR